MSHGKLVRRSKRQAVYLVIFTLICACLYFLWPSSQPRLSLSFVGDDHFQTPKFDLEVANTDVLRERGLMFRKKLGPREGMIFVFPEERNNSFWMKNTYIPLDMLFLDSKLKIVGILKDVPILNTEPRTAPKPSQYVVELAAGVASETKIEVGMTAVVNGTMPLAR